MVAIVTPMKSGIAPDTALDFEAMERLVEFHIGNGTDAIVAVGTGPNPLVQSTTPDLATNKKGYIAVADQETLRTSKKGVFAGGDIVTGAATVILAMGAGRKAARSIHEYLTTGSW